MTNFERQDWRRARKSHVCDICGSPIWRGERYLHCVAMIDGEFYDNCYHEGCCDILEAFDDEYGHGEEYTITNVEDWLRDQCQDVCKKWQDCRCNIFRCEAIRSIPAIMEVEQRNREDENG